MGNQFGIRLILVGVITTVMVLGLGPAGASSANLSHSYKFRQQITDGSIVSLDSNTSDYVEAANTKNGERLLGVSVASNDSLLAVDEKEGAVQIATSGNAKVLVSDLNGDIGVGDQIGVSPFNGVGMRAVNGSRIIGLAQNTFKGAENGVSKQQVTDKDGKNKEIAIGYVSVSIAVGVNTKAAQEDLSGLQKLGKSLTGRTISTTRVLISLVVALVAIISLITLIYASIYGGIISIGRNPLAKYAVYRTIGAVLGMVTIVASIAGFTIFLLLR